MHYIFLGYTNDSAQHGQNDWFSSTL